MRRLLPLLVLLAIPFASVAHADGCPPSTCGTTSVAPTGSSLAFIFANGRQGPLQVYDLRSGRNRFGFPSGMLSADGRVFVSAVHVKRGTRFVRFDTRTGSHTTLRTVPGTWSVVGISGRPTDRTLQVSETRTRNRPDRRRPRAVGVGAIPRQLRTRVVLARR